MVFSRTGHVQALTSLRFFAALLVLLFHFPPQGDGWSVVAGQGHVGVSVFFVLSGFLITQRYAEGVARGTLDLRLYFVRRMARILPLYYFVFVVSQLVTSGGLEFAGRWSEWTLTQALFGESLHDFVIPTAWSLTVEECFYASAPLVFLAVARARRRTPSRPLTASAAVLAAVTVSLFVAGLTIWTVLDGRGPGFLREPDHVTIHTIFGRFYDFGVGAFAAFAMADRRLRSGRLAVLVSVAACALVYFAQQGMAEAGGIEGPGWAQAWAWDLLLAPATALLIVSLTAERNPLARALGVAPLAYLGKVSYALYLVQLTPLGRGFLYRFISREDGHFAILVLYAGLVVTSALLYELVEEPARRLVLRLARDPQAAQEKVPGRTVVLAAAAGAVAVLALAGAVVQGRLETLGPATLDELRSAGLPSTQHHVAATRPGNDVLLVAPPRRWREGWADDLRAPHGVLVFADGQPVPFTRKEPEGNAPAAFFKGPRAEYIALRLPDEPETVTLARPSAWVLTRLHLARLLVMPEAGAPLALAAAVVLMLGMRAPRRLRKAARA